MFIFDLFIRIFSKVSIIFTPNFQITLIGSSVHCIQIILIGPFVQCICCQKHAKKYPISIKIEVKKFDKNKTIKLLGGLFSLAR